MLERTDVTDATRAPFGKPTTKLQTPNIFDLVVVEDVPFSPESYRAIPYKSPHPNYANNGLILVWQGPVKAANNQVVARRVYASENEAPENWYNYAIKYSADAVGSPIYVRSYITLREDYAPTPRGSKLEGVFLLRVTNPGSGYTTAPTVNIVAGFSPGSGATAKAIMSGDKVIGLQLLSEGSDYIVNPAVSFSGGGGSGAAATAMIQPVGAVLVKEETARLDSEDPQLASLFIRVHRIYETLPGPWVPFTRYDRDLGPIQGRRRSVLATPAQKASFSATLKRTYEGRDGSSIVSLEIEESWTTGAGTEDNPSFPTRLRDTYTDERGAVDGISQIVNIAPDEETQEATFSRSGGVVTKVQFEEFDEFHLKRVEEHWVEVVIDDQVVTSEHGGGILDLTERTDEPGAQTPDTGFLVVSSRLRTKSPHEQTKTTEKLSPDSAVPVLELVDGGSGYSSAPAVSFTGGTVVTPATANAILGFGLQSITLNNGGSGYSSPPAIGFINGGGGGAFAVAVLGFGLGSVNVLDGGGSYTSAPTVAVTGDGTGATATAVLGFGVASIAITAGGSGYTDTPGVIFTGDGSGATANVVMGNPVLSVAVDNGGSGYTSPPTVAFAGGGGSGAAATAVLGKAVASGAVTAAGTNFTAPPTVAITGDGTGATADAMLGIVAAIAITAGGTGYTVGDILTLVGGTSTTTAQLLVTTVAAGVITGVSIQRVGAYSIIPGSPVAVTGGTGTGATFTPHWGVSALVITAGGNGYTTAPTVGFTGGGGTGATATTTLAASGVVKTVNVTTGAVVGYTSIPTVSFSGGAGTGAAGTAALDTASFVANRIDVVNPGSGYTSAPTLSFAGGGGTGLAATATMGTVGKVARVNVTAAGSGYTFANIGFSGGAGSGASASGAIATTGKVVSVDVHTPGSFRTVPDVVFEGGGGSGADATAVLAATGSVIELVLSVLGLYTVAPTVVFTGAHTGIATAIYHIGSLLWPAIRGFTTDPTEGIVVNHIKKVVPEGTPHPGRGFFVDMLTHDRWKSIQITSSVDLNTLPLPETYWTTHPFHLLPTLLSIEGVWSDVSAKLASAQKTGAHVSVSSGASGGIIVRRTSGFHGYAKAYITRIWFFGPPPESAVPIPLKMIGSSGSVVITSRRATTQYTNQDDGGSVIGDEDSIQVHSLDVNDHLVGNFAIINPTHQSQPRSAVAVSGGHNIAAVTAYGQVSSLVTSIPLSTPPPLVSGQMVLVAAIPQKWRFGVWVLELIYVRVP